MAKMTSKIHSEVKAAISKIRDRERHETALTPLSRNPLLLNLRGNFQKQLQPVFSKAGVNIDEVNKVLTQYQSERSRILEKEGAATAKSIAALQKTMRNGMENRRKALDLLGSKPFIVTPIPLMSADSIWATPVGMLIDSRIIPGNNVAKIKFVTHDDTGGYPSVSLYFYFFWKNDTQYAAVLNASADLILTGWAGLNAFTSFWGGSHSTMDLTAVMNVFVEGQQISTDSHQRTSIKSLSASGGSDLFGDTGSDSDNIFGTFNLSCSKILVESDQFALFEVGMVASYTINNGSVAVHFCDVIQGNLPLFDGSVICPALNIELLTAPSVTSSPVTTTTGSLARRKKSSGRKR
jgi:hypothetical protein